MQPNPYHTHTKHTELYKVHDFYDLQSRLQALQPWAAHTIFPLQYIDSANVISLGAGWQCLYAATPFSQAPTPLRESLQHRLQWSPPKD